MTLARWSLIITLAAFTLFMGITLILPQQYRVDRSIVINAPAEAIFPHLEDLEKWQKWNPWMELDPEMTIDYGSQSKGVGASYNWASDKAGGGSMTIVSLHRNEEIQYKLNFEGMENFPAFSSLTLTPRGRSTKVLWEFHGDVGDRFFSRWMVLFVESVLGRSFDKGLRNLDRLATAAPAPVAE